jgi:hypothetical protein
MLELMSWKIYTPPPGRGYHPLASVGKKIWRRGEADRKGENSHKMEEKRIIGEVNYYLGDRRISFSS